MLYFLKEINKKDINKVGGKAANLGEMVSLSLPVPEGFVIDIAEYQQFMVENSLNGPIQKYIAEIEKTDSFLVIEKITEAIRKLFETSQLSYQFKEKLIHPCNQLGDGPFAVRSSATLEDSAAASFAGQQDTYLNVNGVENIFRAIIKCWASLWNTRSVMYRIKKGIPIMRVSLAVIIQKLVIPEAAGVLFTKNPLNPGANQMLLEGVWGFGEGVVSGRVSPDQWVMDAGTGIILQQRIAKKEYEIASIDEGVITQPVIFARRNEPVLLEKSIQKLFTFAQTLVHHYQKDQDIEWASVNQQIYLLQTRPITTN